MTKDNVTGKNKDFYDLGKKIFDRLNPQEITVKQNGKVILDFIMSETELKIAAKLGLTKENYIKEKVKSQLKENSTSERNIQTSDSKSAESAQP
jgi:endo-alpha-1,4-polygalactosaminidase (GH114 family)